MHHLDTMIEDPQRATGGVPVAMQHSRRYGVVHAMQLCDHIASAELWRKSVCDVVSRDDAVSDG